MRNIKKSYTRKIKYAGTLIFTLVNLEIFFAFFFLNFSYFGLKLFGISAKLVYCLYVINLILHWDFIFKAIQNNFSKTL
jgi:hypothetical protein